MRGALFATNVFTDKYGMTGALFNHACPCREKVPRIAYTQCSNASEIDSNTHPPLAKARFNEIGIKQRPIATRVRTISDCIHAINANARLQLHGVASLRVWLMLSKRCVFSLALQLRQPEQTRLRVRIASGQFDLCFYHG